MERALRNRMGYENKRQSYLTPPQSSINFPNPNLLPLLVELRNCAGCETTMSVWMCLQSVTSLASTTGSGLPPSSILRGAAIGSSLRVVPALTTFQHSRRIEDCRVKISFHSSDFSLRVDNISRHPL